MHAPQIIWIIMASSAITVGIANHGKTEVETTSAWTNIIGVALESALLWWGGFFG